MGLKHLDAEETGVVETLADHQPSGYAAVVLEVKSELDQRVTLLPIRCAEVAPVGIVAVPADRGAGIIVAAEHRKGRIAEIRDIVSTQQCSRSRQDTAVMDVGMHQGIGQRVGDGRISAFDAPEGLQSTGAHLAELLRRGQVPKDKLAVPPEAADVDIRLGHDVIPPRTSPLIVPPLPPVRSSWCPQTSSPTLPFRAGSASPVIRSRATP